MLYCIHNAAGFGAGIRETPMSTILTYILITFACLLRTCAAGFSYIPILDDSIQLISLPSSQNYAALIEQQGLLATRPLAGLSDLYFTGRFSNLFIPALLYSALFGVAGVLFYHLFHRYFHTGHAFTVLFSLLPLGVEGTYWLAASTRIVPGLLFTALAALVLDDFINRGGFWRVLLFAPLSLLSFSFYEQILALSLTLSALQFLAYVRHNKRAFAAFIALLMAAAYFAFTAQFASKGTVGSRMELAFPTTFAYYTKYFLPELLRQIGAAFLKGGSLTLFRGFVRGILSSASAGGVLYLILSAAAGTALFILLRPASKTAVTPLRPVAYPLIWGVLLALAPISPYFVIANPWFSMRACVPAFVGIGLILDLACRALFRREMLYNGVCAVMCTVFLIAGASEVRDYQETARMDQTVAEEILAHADQMSGRVGLLCVEEFPLAQQNYAYHEHIASAGASEWALYGKIVAVCRHELDFAPVPLATKGFSFYRGWNRDIKRISGFDQVWAWNADSSALVQLDVRMTGTHDADLYLPDGTLFARIWEEPDEIGYVQILP